MQTLVFILLAPLFGSFLTALYAWSGNRGGRTLAVVSLSASLAFSASLLFKVAVSGPVEYAMGGWSPPWGIVLRADALSAAMLCLISWTSLTNLLAAVQDVPRCYPERENAFYALYLLATVGHLGIVTTGDAFNLYVLIEVAALSGYALLSLGGARAQLASLNYLLVGSVGASLYLLGVGFLYIMVGSLNMADLASLVASIPGSPALAAAFALVVAGLWIKMALFPFHGWLPGAYSSSALPAAGLLAPMTTKVMAYVLVRMLLSVFPPGFADELPGFADAGLTLATAAIVIGALLALMQRNLIRMLCFILVAEVGYMVGGVFVGNATAMTGAALHILADALMTVTLFIAAGNITSRRNGLSYTDMRGLFKEMPWTMAGFVAGAMCMIGVPPFFGFFSKWYLVSGALQAGGYVFAASLILSSLVNVVLFFRIFETAFFETPEETAQGRPGGEVSWTRLVPLGAAALALIVAGLCTGLLVENIITPVLNASAA